MFAPFGWKTAVFIAASIAGIAVLPWLTPRFFRRFGNRPSELEAKFLLLCLFAFGALAWGICSARGGEPPGPYYPPARGVYTCPVEYHFKPVACLPPTYRCGCYDNYCPKPMPHLPCPVKACCPDCCGGKPAPAAPACLPPRPQCSQPAHCQHCRTAQRAPAQQWEYWLSPHFKVY
jgi:hypothetical protein